MRVVFWMVLALCCDGASAQDLIKTVGLRHGALVVSVPGSPDQEIVKTGPARGLPVWSADGLQIAFVQAVDRTRALAELVIVSAQGREQARIAIEPAEAGVADAGMRYVESLQWISPSRIAVRGSINPSQAQYEVIDVTSGQVVADFVDDGAIAAFSSDGAHVAYQVGSPHFSPVESRSAALLIDGRLAYPLSPRPGLQFVSAPQWSADCRCLAVVTQEAGDSVSRLVVWREGQISERGLDLGAADQIELSWAGDQITLKATGFESPQHPRVWVSDAQGLKLNLVSATQATADPLIQVRALRQATLDAARKNGLAEPDAWCAHCGLELLPRRSE